MHAVFLIAATTTVTTNSNSTNLDVNPADGSGLPGEGTLSDLASGLGHWALLAAVVGVIVGGVLWAFGHFSHNYQQSYNGRKGVIVSGVAALLIGASQELISFFFSAGLKLH
jgi:type IV secretory pathway VirB2 component (pilin)